MHTIIHACIRASMHPCTHAHMHACRHSFARSIDTQMAHRSAISHASLTVSEALARQPSPFPLTLQDFAESPHSRARLRHPSAADSVQTCYCSLCCLWWLCLHVIVSYVISCLVYLCCRLPGGASEGAAAPVEAGQKADARWFRQAAWTPAADRNYTPPPRTPWSAQYVFMRCLNTRRLYV